MPETQVYQASVHGFLRLALGLSLLTSEASEEAVTSALEPRSRSTLLAVLDALEGFASLHEEREQARRELLALPAAGGVSGEDEPVAGESASAADPGEGEGAGPAAPTDEAENRAAKMRDVVRRLRRRLRA